ncbi:pyridoxamine 5'-phosphate oxidase family protein [Candidatus Bathyarchaeota archaeon]|nr:pyridoxamine 5'-phosphate oxidase family protein [Candidatus Bathyarchaeota archaeon]
MANLPKEAQETFTKQRVISLGTVDAEGKPNTSYVAFWWFEDDETVVLVDNFMRKTRANLENSGWAAVSAYNMDIHRAYQLKGKAVIETEGPRVERGKKMAEKFEKERGMKMPAKAAIAVKVEEIYYLQPGPEAGKTAV